jgi:hypothetical protein
MNPVLFLLLTLYFLAPQQAPAKQAGLPPEIEQLTALAQSTPTEFAAATLIRIAQSGKVADRNLLKKLLEEAFELAGSARYPFRLKHLEYAHTDTWEDSRYNALNIGLTRMSLQVAVVKAMSAVDAAEARRLFAQIHIRELPPHRCEDALVEDVAEFYELPRTLASEGKPGRLLLDHVETMSSPRQIPGMVEAVLAAPLAKKDLIELVDALTVALIRIQADDRTFSAGLYDQLRSLDRLIQECRRKEVGTTGLLNAVRTYLAGHFSARRCADNLRLTEGESVEARYLKRLDDSFREAGIPPISETERVPLKIEGRAQIHDYWESPKTKPLLMGIRALRFDAGERLSLERRQSPDWQQALEVYLTKLEGWTESDEPSLANYLNQRCILYGGLLDLAPPGPARATVLASFLGFLERFAVQDETGLEWYVHAQRTVRLSARPADRRMILDAYRNSRNPVLVLYAETERLLGSATAPLQSRD